MVIKYFIVLLCMISFLKSFFAWFSLFMISLLMCIFSLILKLYWVFFVIFFLYMSGLSVFFVFFMSLENNPYLYFGGFFSIVLGFFLLLNYKMISKKNSCFSQYLTFSDKFICMYMLLGFLILCLLVLNKIFGSSSFSYRMIIF